ncbi:GPR endopeptidase [Dorea sp. NSJ-36]|uniref:Germination protease n=1 Tax=Dorea hominis TaxID=2763040 RepID=A0ABR7EVG0_9FIRM|nr:GPR endopeptidase [Dorea hominis]MBC5664699.1 GPR endopeptidase [Dorea hominis]
MMDRYNVRTDLALEQRERFVSDQIEIPGVAVEETYDDMCEVRVTTVRIETENGAAVMGKPVGNYITLEAPKMAEADESYHREISGKLMEVLEGCLPEKEDGQSILIIGLGNRNVTPDALGPLVVEHLDITRHLVKEYGKYALDGEADRLVSAVVPGVMGQTGMETVEIVRGIVEETEPDFVIAIDALAARSVRRLNRTIQIADTGIAPGSGVGNHRNAITEETVGVPVIAIGVPTVVDAATIVGDSIEEYVAKCRDEGMRENKEHLIPPYLYGMFVTPKDIDETMERTSYTISEALNALAAGQAHI